MSHHVLMTFPTHKWKEYGQYCLPSFDKNWPEHVQGSVYLEGEQKVPYEYSDRVEIIDFDQRLGDKIKSFEERNKNRDIFDLGTTGAIGKQAAKFARKVYAQLDALRSPKGRYVWYVDADLQTCETVPDDLLDNLTSGNHYIGCLPRKWKPMYTETGFILWDTHHPAHQEWCDLYQSCYDDDKIFEFNAWHDCIAFDYATDTLLSSGKISIADFGYGVKSSHPLVTGPLGRYFDHMKGKRKFVGHSKERRK
ncbi:MAG: hypothetical protein N0C84_01270 [Candidatus Thiodiazotropha taylori]|uniref:Uncharacterized protein n=1 Tax=Candidatus Thiodiazotropha taylori TaxID=2792791 RepID=A0A9E4K8S7_9GAMM|nr:hypothetical protein [Candidatus Thiodiazotropha taylori]MCW4255077.1 hypothetical protein [Candidatus Thiodiazotropha taylori]